MPFKNESKYLQKTIDSILSQSEKGFELIAVDDHSEDESYQIVQKYAELDPRIKLVTNYGSGTIDGLKTAYSHISGTLISRMDADDIMPKNKLTELKFNLLEKGSGYVSTGLVKYFSDSNLSQGFINYADWLNKLCKTDSHRNQLFKECVIASPNWMMFKDDFDRIGGFTDAIYPEDYHLVFKMFEHNMNVVSSDKITHLWRDHELRASRTQEHYKDQKFFPLKIDVYIKFYGTEKVNLWGTGPSGKKLAKELIKRNIEFHWVTGSERKIGETIYGVKVHHFDTLKNHKDNRVIIAVTQKGSRSEILDFLKKIELNNYDEF